MARMKELQGTALGELDNKPGGEPTLYRYEEPNGALAFFVGRIDKPDGTKTVRPFTQEGDKELPAKYRKPGSRPLYNLPALVRANSGAKVIWVEGEKCVEAAKAVFPAPDYIVVCSQGGANGINYTDWKPLDVKPVLLIADTNGAGRLAVRKIADKLTRRGMYCDVRIYGRPGDDKSDIADWAEGLGETELLALRLEIEGGAVHPKDFGKDDSQPSNGLVFDEPEPWPEPVDGGELLSGISNVVREHMHISDEQADTVALWIVLAWIHGHKDIEVAPFLNITAATKRAGKSTLLEIVSAFVPRALPAADASPAFLFRVIEQRAPTLLLDEMDGKRDNSDLSAILNGSQKRNEAFVGRTTETRRNNVKDYEPSVYSTWCPKVLCGIGGLRDTTVDRSIQIRLERAEKRPKRWRERERDKVAEIRRKLAKLAADKQDDIVANRPKPPEELNDRQADSWELLLSIGEAVGGEWPTRALTACREIAQQADDTITIPEQLISDLRAVFIYERDPEYLSTATILKHLNSMTDRRWPTLRKGKSMIGETLSFYLRKFGIKSRQQKMQDTKQNLRVYDLAPIERLAARYPAPKGDNALEMLGNTSSGQERGEEPW